MKKICVVGTLIMAFFYAILAIVAEAGSSIAEEEINQKLIESCVSSEVSSNLFVIFRSEKNGMALDAFASDMPIKFGFIATTNAAYRNYNIFMPDLAYGYKISLKSENGESLPLTRLGNKYGNKYNEVNSYDRGKVDWSKQAWDRHFDREFPYLATASKWFKLTRGLPPPEKLFEITKPGKYSMTIEMQVWSCRSNQGKTNQIYLVKFPPVKLQVVKKDD